MMGSRVIAQRGDIRANDPLIRELLEAVAASGIPDQQIIRRAGSYADVLTHLRAGRISTRLVTFVALAEAVGMAVRLEARQ